MHKTLYIDIDEEVTNIVDRIAQEKADEFYLVVPKDAMLVQGIINLKLLKKEAENLGKIVMLVTADKFAKRVIERAGLETRDRVEEGHSSHRSQKAIKEEHLAQKATQEVYEVLNQEYESIVADDQQIGSASFFDNSGANQQPLGNVAMPEMVSATELVLPKKRTPVRPAVVSMREVSVKPLPRTNHRNVPMVHSHPHHPINRVHPIVNNEKLGESHFDSKKAEAFFAAQPEEELNQPEVGIPKQPLFNEIKRKKPYDANYKAVALLWAVAFLATAGVSVWTIMHFPKAKIIFYPRQKLVENESIINVSENVTVANTVDNAIPGKYVELDIAHTLEFSSTEEKFSSDSGRAKGKVTISNNYSATSHPLVATTRLLSKENKLFRIVKNVVVPPMKDGQPGEVEVDVIADEPGTSFNVEASTFTIEGFKGNSKYEKITGVSNARMEGGEDAQGNKKVKAVSVKDLDHAREATMDALEKEMSIKIQEKLKANEKIVKDGWSSEIAGTNASAKAGDVADKFTYTVNKKVKAVVFSEKDLRILLESQLAQKAESGYALKDVKDIGYKRAVFDEQKKNLIITVDANGLFSPMISKENVKKGIIGKSQEEMKQFLSSYKEIDKVEVQFIPAWLKRLPVSDDKIEIEEATN